MGKIVSVKPVKIIIGFIFKVTPSFDMAKSILTKRFGRIDFESRIMPFNLTDYYQEEFGEGLSRVFISFYRLIKPEQIAGIKLLTNRIEKRLANGKRRTVNIDPGYVDLAKLVLVSTKDYIHRIYLAKGIYAETTLFFQGKSFQDWQWTYPDFRSPEYITVFNQIRELYARQIRSQ